MKEDNKTNGFNTPQNYFEDFEERLFLKISEDIIPKESGFKIPDNYFENVEDVIVNKVNENTPQPKIISLFTKKTILYAVSIAACAAIVFSIFNVDDGMNEIIPIQVSEIEEYIDEGNISFDTYDLTSMLSEEEDFSLENDLFSEEILEEYLLESIDDDNLFLE